MRHTTEERIDGRGLDKDRGLDKQLELEPGDEELGGFADETRIARAPSRAQIDAADAEALAAGPMGRIPVDKELPEHLKPRLEITAGAGRGKVQGVSKPLVILGRVEGVADIVVPSNAASRHHAALGYKDGQFMIYDMGSTNGTRVNGERVTQCAVSHGDEVEIGDCVFTFWVD